jgi:hypothetical protein
MRMPETSWLQHPHTKRIGFVLLFYLFGPMILRVRHIWRKATGPSWHAEIRWERTLGSALLSLLWYVPIVLLASPLGSFWVSIFVTLARWFHFAQFALLGGTDFYLPVPGSLLLRWLLAYPLSGIVACGLEMFWPRTTWQSKRVITADEQFQLTQQVAAEKKRLKAPHSPSTEDGMAKKKRQPRAKVQPRQMVPVTPPTDSLWGQINWSAVPDSDPLKREALAARTEQQQAIRNQQQQTMPYKNPQTPKRSEQRTPPQIIDAKPAPPTTYNWDEGEGSIQE